MSDPKDYKWWPDAEYRFFLYDPEGDGLTYYRTEEARDAAAAEAISQFLEDGGWSEGVEGVSAGVVTHIAKVLDRQDRPEELDEDGCDKDGLHWPSGVDFMCGYTLAPIKRKLMDNPAYVAAWMYGEPMAPCPACGSYNMKSQMPIKLHLTDKEAEQHLVVLMEGPCYFQCNDCLHKGPAVNCAGRTRDECLQDPKLKNEMKLLWNSQASHVQGAE